ncbi:MAG TPA: class I SAM-dependent methyltransferase [Rugosimonospora sp.]|jgi:SAM-dependent methyltransferase
MTSRTTRTYAYDNDSAEATAHHEALASLLDPLTRWRITDLIRLTGARCLDVGAGAGSVAAWLADRVGPEGSVTATDTKPRLIPAHPRLHVLEHDITSSPPPGGEYDLVHARGLLNHLPQRRQVLQRLAEAVAPGGVLLTEDFWPTSPHETVAHATSEEDATLIRRFHLAHLRTLAEYGNDRGWSRRALLAFMEEGLTDVHSVAYGGTWRGGGAGCRLLIAGSEQLREQLSAAGLTGDELDHVHALLRDPSIVLHGHLLYSTSGRRPSTVDGHR